MGEETGGNDESVPAERSRIAPVKQGYLYNRIVEESGSRRSKNAAELRGGDHSADFAAPRLKARILFDHR